MTLVNNQLTGFLLVFPQALSLTLVTAADWTQPGKRNMGTKGNILCRGHARRPTEAQSWHRFCRDQFVASSGRNKGCLHLSTQLVVCLDSSKYPLPSTHVFVMYSTHCVCRRERQNTIHTLVIGIQRIAHTLHTLFQRHASLCPWATFPPVTCVPKDEVEQKMETART